MAATRSPWQGTRGGRPRHAENEQVRPVGRALSRWSRTDSRRKCYPYPCHLAKTCGYPDSLRVPDCSSSPAPLPRPPSRSTRPLRASERTLHRIEARRRDRALRGSLGAYSTIAQGGSPYKGSLAWDEQDACLAGYGDRIKDREQHQSDEVTRTRTRTSIWYEYSSLSTLYSL
jgi:hypothetical protein